MNKILWIVIGALLAVILVSAVVVTGLFLTRSSLLQSPAAGEKPQVSSSTVSNRFGCQAALGPFTEEEKAAGIGSERVWIKWDDIEPAQDSYDWSKMDATVKEGNDAGIELLGYFYKTPEWAKKNPTCQADICAINDMEEFRELARDVAQRYDGKHGFGELKYIEILNEVTMPGFFDPKNTDYRDWLVAGYEGVKEGNPDAQVLIGGFVNPLDVKNFVEEMLRDYDRYYDIVNFHVYSVDSAVNDATVYIKEQMSRYGVNKPMWITETATIPKPNDPDPLERMTQGIIKRYASAFGNGVERVFWWPFIGNPTQEENAQYGGKGKVKVVGLGWVYPKGSGMPTDEFHPRQAYRTFQLMTSKIGGFSSVQKIADTQYKFIVNGKAVYALWSDGETSAVPDEISGTVKVTDYLGNVETMDAAQINLTEKPVFVENE